MTFVMTQGNDYNEVRGGMVVKQRLLDCHLIYIASLLLLLGQEGLFLPVIVALVGLSALEALVLCSKPWELYALLSIFAVACFFFPQLTYVLPALIYVVAAKKAWPGSIALVLFFVGIRDFPEYWQMGLWWVLIAFAFLLGVRTTAQLEEEARLRELRDDSVEFERSMKRRNQELLEKQDYEVHLATLSERNRIAREIHDNVGHMLSRSILQLGALMTVYKKDALIYEQLESVNASLNEAMNNIRESVHDLHDEAVDLRHAIYEAVSGMGESYEVHVDYDMTPEVPRNVKYCMIAIVREALANVVKHSDANKVSVMLREHPGFYQLMVEDNGTGQNEKSEPGIGLINMEERVKALDGTINFRREHGFSILVSIPKGER